MEIEIVNRGNCMLCGKPLTEGLFFCEDCERRIIEASNENVKERKEYLVRKEKSKKR